MKKYDYYRPSAASLGKKRRVVRRQKGSSFFFKLFFLLLVIGLLGAGAWVLQRGYRAFVSSDLSRWQVKQVVVSGVSGNLQKQLASLAKPWEGKPFSIQDAVSLRGEILTRYPMLKEVSVKRGLMSGKLNISARARTPLAQFVLPDGTVKYLDRDRTVYTDPNPDRLLPVPSVELEGQIPDQLSAELVEWVESVLKLRRTLEFTSLQMNLADNTVKMELADGCKIDFGNAVNLKRKAARAAQIMALSQEKYPRPFRLDFHFFEDGKIFLTPQPA